MKVHQHMEENVYPQMGKSAPTTENVNVENVDVTKGMLENVVKLREKMWKKRVVVALEKRPVPVRQQHRN